MIVIAAAIAAAALAWAEPAPDPQAEAAEIAAIYEAWRPLAEAVGRMEALDEHDRDIARRVAGAPPLPVDLSDYLTRRREARRATLRAVLERHDPVALIERAPQTANFLTRLVRMRIDADISAALMERFEPLAGTPALHPMVYDSLVQRPISSPEPNPARPPEDADTLARFNAEIGIHQTLVEQLGAAHGRDHFVRAVFVPKLAEFGAEVGPFIEAFSPVIGAVDAQNTQIAWAALEDPGFEMLHNAAPGAAERAIAILHHGASLEQRRGLLEVIEPLALAGDFDGQRYALMYDRLAEAEGRPQRYGSQDACIDGRREIYSLEDAERVDAWRAQMGMGPLDEYRAGLIDMYGPAC